MAPRTWTRALVTGASTGIGAAISRRLAAEGTHLVVVARDRTRLDDLADELTGTDGVDVEVLPADLADPAALAQVEARLADGSAPVDLLVNNAGFGTYGPFAESDVDEETREIAVNVVAVSRLTHAAVTGMVERGRGAVLNVSSLAARLPAPLNPTYAATKAYVSQFSEALHEHLRTQGVTVTVLEPGYTRTEFQARAGIEDARVPDIAWQSAEAVAEVGLEAVRAGRAVAVPGWGYRVAAGATGVIPRGARRRLLGIVSDVAGPD